MATYYNEGTRQHIIIFASWQKRNCTMNRTTVILKYGLLIGVLLVSFILLLRPHLFPAQPFQNEHLQTPVFSAKNENSTQSKKEQENIKAVVEEDRKTEAKLKVVYASLGGCIKHTYLPEYKALCFRDYTYRR